MSESRPERTGEGDEQPGAQRSSLDGLTGGDTRDPLAASAAAAVLECLNGIASLRSKTDDRPLAGDEVIAIRRCLSDYIAVLRALNMAPEHAMAIAKGMVARSLREWDDAVRSASALVVGLIVESYYPSGGSPPVPSAL